MIFNVVKSIIKNRLNIVSYPSFITFLVTWRCNGRCIFCDVWKNRAGQTDELSLQDIEKIFKQFKKLDVLRLTGGEPFLRSDLADIINLIDKNNKPGMIHITTNGILTETIIKTINSIKPANKVHIKISIDNVGEKHDKVRGVPGTYKNAINTIEGLMALQKEKKFHIGVNQVIVSENEIDAYFSLKKVMDKYNIPIYPVIANEPTNSLYSDTNPVDPNMSFKTFGKFSELELERFMKILIKHGKEVGDLKEQIVDRYHLKGLYNRLSKKINKPNPRCVAINNHLRLLPNGDVPICLYNGQIIGNLKNEKFKDIWFNEKAQAHRQWVKKCPGCWQSCETAVSAIYTGDIYKGLFY